MCTYTRVLQDHASGPIKIGSWVVVPYNRRTRLGNQDIVPADYLAGRDPLEVLSTYSLRSINVYYRPSLCLSRKIISTLSACWESQEPRLATHGTV